MCLPHIDAVTDGGRLLAVPDKKKTPARTTEDVSHGLGSAWFSLAAKAFGWIVVLAGSLAGFFAFHAMIIDPAMEQTARRAIRIEMEPVRENLTNSMNKIILEQIDKHEARAKALNKDEYYRDMEEIERRLHRNEMRLDKLRPETVPTKQKEQ